MSYDKYILYKRQISLDGGSTWNDVDPLETTPSGDPVATYDTITECEAIPTVNMDGKLFVNLNESGTVVSSYNCYTGSTTASTVHPNFIIPQYNSYYTEPALTGALTGGLSKYNYIGSCVNGFESYAFRSVPPSTVKSVYVYFDGGRNYNLSIGMFYQTPIEKIVLPDSNTLFSTYTLDSSYPLTDGVFEGGSGDISNVISRLTNVGCNCFKDGDFGSTATFDQNVTLYKRAFYFATFSTLVFNNGFVLDSSIGGADISDVFHKDSGTYTVILNGCIQNYPNNVVDLLEDVGLTVIDNTYLW